MTDATETAEAPKPNRRVQAKARTYQKVLEAAAGLFAAKGGYEAATIRSIAKAAGMSTGAVYANFPDKETLYRAIYGHAPVTPEKGRELLAAMESMITWHVMEEGSPHGHDAARHEEIQKLRAAVESVRPVKANFE